MEHHAILNQIPHIDLPIQKAPVCSNGVVDLGWIEDRLNRFDVGLVSIMAVNNETGVKQPINEIADLCRKYGAIFHTDAVQAIGHMEINVSDVGIDLLSLSGHKFGRSDGIGGFVHIEEGKRYYFSYFIWRRTGVWVSAWDRECCGDSWAWSCCTHIDGLCERRDNAVRVDVENVYQAFAHLRMRFPSEF